MYDFPNAPTVGQVYDKYTWDGEKWVAPPVVSSSFPTGTVLLFYQAAAPTGWTQVATQNNKALRVVSGVGGVAGGTNSFSTVMAQTVVGSDTPSGAKMAVHAHTVYPGGDGTGGTGPPTTGGPYTNNAATGTAGSGSAHNHTITMNIQYIDIILASKN